MRSVDHPMTMTAPADTGSRIERAALELFGERGFAATGIRDLAQRAGVTSSALYHYMGTKEDLLVRMMNRGNVKLLALAREATRGVDGCAARLARLVLVHVEAHVRAPLEATVIDTELRALSPGARGGVVAVRDRYEQLWQGVLTEGHRAGVFQFRQLGVARLCLLEMCTGVVHWYSPSGPLDVQTLCETFVDMAFNLVGACENGKQLTHADVDVPDVNLFFRELEARPAVQEELAAIEADSAHSPGSGRATG